MSPLSRILGFVLAGSVLAAIVLAVVEFFLPMLIDGSDLLIAAACIVAGFAVPALGCAAAFDRGRARILMLTGLAASSLAALAWIAMVWAGSFSPVLGMPPTCWAGLMLLVALTLRHRLRSGWAVWLRRLTILIGTLLAVHICVSVCLYPVLEEKAPWAASQRFAEIAARSGGVLGILTALGLVALLVVTESAQLTGEGAEPFGEFVMRAVCPRCGQRIELRSGGDQCSACGLKIRVSPT